MFFYCALKILDKIDDSHFTTELALFNLEINLDPMELSGDCFSRMDKHLSKLISHADDVAGKIEENKIILFKNYIKDHEKYS